MAKIEIKNVTCGYKVRKSMIIALDNISLTLENEKLTAIIGKSGSGKTTILKCIMGSEEYDGEILFDGVNVENIPTKDRHLSYVSQDLVLYPHLTVYQNIAYPLTIRNAPVDEIRRRVADVAELVGISSLLSRKPRQISIGQAQRVSIARAVVKNPSLFIFDEPFSNIDPIIKESIRIELSKILKKIGATTIFVTHDIKEAFLLADNIYVIDEGKIVDFGTPNELIESKNNITIDLLSELKDEKVL